MADLWEKFESDCFEYLVNTYSNAKFEAYGKSDSTKPDIEVKLHNGKFFIEVKSPYSLLLPVCVIPK